MSYYNDMFTLITENSVEKELPSNIKLYNFDNETAYTKIKVFEINKHTMYNGHIIMKSKQDFTLIDKVNSLNLTDNIVYSKKVVHSGIASECFIDSSFLICNSWNLPFIIYTYRTSSNLYANLKRHRVKMIEI